MELPSPVRSHQRYSSRGSLIRLSVCYINGRSKPYYQKCKRGKLNSWPPTLAILPCYHPPTVCWWYYASWHPHDTRGSRLQSHSQVFQQSLRYGPKSHWILHFLFQHSPCGLEKSFQNPQVQKVKPSFKIPRNSSYWQTMAKESLGENAIQFGETQEALDPQSP